MQQQCFSDFIFINWWSAFLTTLSLNHHKHLKCSVSPAGALMVSGYGLFPLCCASFVVLWLVFVVLGIMVSGYGGPVHNTISTTQQKQASCNTMKLAQHNEINITQRKQAATQQN